MLGPGESCPSDPRAPAASLPFQHSFAGPIAGNQTCSTQQLESGGDIYAWHHLACMIRFSLSYSNEDAMVDLTDSATAAVCIQSIPVLSIQPNFIDTPRLHEAYAMHA